MDAHLNEWLNLLVRWIHVIFGIAWIGASFYFNFLENALNRTENLRDELAGNLWAVHGGGFYYLEKYKIAPKKLPKTLHWFKYEAYFTWISGFTLLTIVYYFNAEAFMIDPEVCDIHPMIAVGIGIWAIFLSWAIYELLCQTTLVKNNTLFALAMFVILVFASWALCQVLSPRAAYIHVGAMIGTMMTANVFFVIIPGQKAMVKAASEGKIPDPQKGKDGGVRSLHNNYFTLPIVFIMISNHFPSTFGSEYNWIVLAALGLGSTLVRHYLNVTERGEKNVWILPIATVIMIALVLVTAPPGSSLNLSQKSFGDSNAPKVSFNQVQAVIQLRCTPCHSATPSDDVFLTAPNGVKYDTPDQVKRLANKIWARAVATQSMPPANKTKMTQAERDLLHHWIEQGAIVE